MKAPTITYEGIGSAPQWAQDRARSCAEEYAYEGLNRTPVECKLTPLDDGSFRLTVWRGMKLWNPTISEHGGYIPF